MTGRWNGLSNGALLDMLQKERAKFTKSDDVLMNEMIEELVVRGVYPSETLPANPNTVRQMVSGWGAYWSRPTAGLNCPHCKADLQDHRLGPPFMHNPCNECGKPVRCVKRI